jgi:hypothetical protein
VTSFLISLCIMFVVVGASVKWAVREQRRRDHREDGHARHH